MLRSRYLLRWAHQLILRLVQREFSKAATNSLYFHSSVPSQRINSGVLLEPRSSDRLLLAGRLHQLSPSARWCWYAIKSSPHLAAFIAFCCTRCRALDDVNHVLCSLSEWSESRLISSQGSLDHLLSIVVLPTLKINRQSPTILLSHQTPRRSLQISQLDESLEEQIVCRYNNMC